MTKTPAPKKPEPTPKTAPLEYRLKSSCRQGFTRSDLENLFTPEELKKFQQWMYGQTMGVCNGKRWNYIRKHSDKCGHDELDGFTWKCDYLDGGWYEATSCSALPDGTHVDKDTVLTGHGVVAYRYDVERYIEGGIAKAIFD